MSNFPLTREEAEAAHKRFLELEAEWKEVGERVRAAVTYYWTEIDGQRVKVARYPSPHEVVDQEKTK